MMRVYLDSNVIMRFLFEPDDVVKTIFEASKNGKIEAYISWLSLTEFNSVTSSIQNPLEIAEGMQKVLRDNKINIFAIFDPRLSSGSSGSIITNLDYSDSLHLLVAKAIGVNYFITYDKDLLVKKRYGEFEIINPEEFYTILEGSQ